MKLLHPSNANRFLNFAEKATIKTGVQGSGGRKYIITGVVPSRKDSKKVSRERTLVSAIKRLDKRVKIGPSKSALKNVTFTLTNVNKKHFKDLRSKRRKERGKSEDNNDNDNSNSNINNVRLPQGPNVKKPSGLAPRKKYSGI
jgi:hypothetical protein